MSTKGWSIQSSKLKIKFAQLLGCFNAVFEGEYFRGHLASKSAVRIGPNIRRYKIHKPVGFSELAISHTQQVQLLHYDCVNIDDWKMKWDRRIDGSGHTKSLRQNRKQQKEDYQNARAGSGSQLSKLYKKMHVLHKREFIQLYLLRMLSVVKLDKALFDKPAG